MTERSKKPTLRTDLPPRAPVRESMEEMETHVFDSHTLKRPSQEFHVKDTIVDGVDAIDPATYQTPVSIEDSGSFRREATTPIQVISMKTPGAVADRETPPRVIPQVQLRAMADVKPAAPAQNLGYFAPPLDPKQVRARRARDLVIWGSLAVIIASAIAIAMWFLAR